MRLRRLRPFRLVFSVVSVVALSACESAVRLERTPQWVEGRVLVKFRDGADPAEVSDARVRAGARRYDRLPLVGAEVILLEESVTVGEAVASLTSAGSVVEWAEPDFLYDHFGVPSEFDESVLWGHARVHAPDAWETTTGSKAVVVAVIDTGVDAEHADLAGNLWRNVGEVKGNATDDDGNGYVDDVVGWDFAEGDGDPDDEVGHGTHVAGTIGMIGGNDGLVGISPTVRLMILKTISPSGGSTSDSVKAIDYARRNGARVINASWGSYGFSSALREAIARAGQAGILFVAAAGNAGRDADESPMFPAAFDLPTVLSVAASTRGDRLADFSNWGAETVDLAAPGVDVVSAIPGEKYAAMDGTSMAAPHVTGAVALVLSVAPALPVARVRGVILESVDPRGDLAGLVASGGRLNVARAVSWAIPEGNPAPPPAPDPLEWNWLEATGGSDHPYADNLDTTWSVTVSGASEVRLRFDRISTEAGYDFLTIFDGGGNEIARYDGEHGPMETEAIPGEVVYVRLSSDETVMGYGFELAAIGWR